MNGDAYKNLLEVVKLVLVLSHDQAAAERGFSVNKEAEVENIINLLYSVGNSP